MRRAHVASPGILVILVPRSHAPAWECIPTIVKTTDLAACIRVRYAFPRGAWERGILSQSHGTRYDYRIIALMIDRSTPALVTAPTLLPFTFLWQFQRVVLI